ncbi:uncharacterized protein LOC114915475 [Cajanus cajan]|uniref:uncharacterized protein LOC114915475 n=1 Tax=Cajanus cajan TaxID=3821 RepID=UPI0010FADA27|nr:uncharacterized protein LOC114915475 [Cajanus cajan]
MWKHMKDALSLSDEVKEYAMKQIQSQYKNKLYHLHQLYLKKKGRPKNVSPDDWNWLINNKWSDLKFQERSLKNKVNRSKQEMKSITGTKSIVQKAFEMKQESKADEWPNAMEVWKATRMRSNGTWCIPNGEQIMVSKKIFYRIYVVIKYKTLIIYVVCDILYIVAIFFMC